MATVILTPKKGGNSVTKGAKLLTKKGDTNEVLNMENGKIAGDYNGEELPGSVQGRRIRYSLSKRKFLILDEFGKEISHEQIQEVVKGCYLTYEDGPKKGQIIETADPHNRKDPFFNHGQLSLLMKEGNGKLEDTDPKDRLLIYGLNGSSEFSGSKDKARSAAVRYIISDKEKEANILSKDRNRNIEAIKLFSALSDTKKISIARIMGLGVDQTNDREIVDQAIYTAITGKRTNSEGILLQELFVRICSMPSEEFNLRNLIAQAKANRVVEPSKTGWKFRGQRIASTDDGLYDYFYKVENHENLLLLEEAMGRVAPKEND
jgi:hypothetical protein